METWCRGADCESLMLWGLVQVQNCDAVVVNCGNATDAGKWHHGDLGHIKKKKKSPKLTQNPACYLDSSGAPSMIWMVAFFIPWNQEMSRTTFTTGCVISQLIIF